MSLPPVPRDPDQFFRSYVPERFLHLGDARKQVRSEGAIVFTVGNRAPLALRIGSDALEVSEGVPTDSIVQVTLSESAFEPILVRSAELIDEQAARNPEQRLALLNALSLDAERVAPIRAVIGTVAFVLRGDQAEHRLLLTPGSGAVNQSAPECVVSCQLSDFLAMQSGVTNPFELMMNGKIQITGNAQLPMALSSLLV